MKIISLPTYAAQINKLLDDMDIWSLEEHVAENPEAGDVIPKGKGLRKLRWALPGQARGKRGGIRVIYYYWVEKAVIFVAAYSKSEKEDLSTDELKALTKSIGELPS